MSRFRASPRQSSRRKAAAAARSLEILESRSMLADGITPVSAPAMTAVAGVPLRGAVLATYTVSDPSGDPGDKWRALINFGDGHSEGPLIPIQSGNNFEFVDSHTYAAPGTYTVTVMIAVPGSQKPNDNTETVTVTVTSPVQPPPPNHPPPDNSVLTASGLNLRAKDRKTFSGPIARFKEAGAKAPGFRALIDWGDQRVPASGRIRALAKGRFQVSGSHRYLSAGLFHVTVTIADGHGRSASAMTIVNVHR